MAASPERRVSVQPGLGDEHAGLDVSRLAALRALAWPAAIMAVPFVAALVVYWPFVHLFFATDDFHWLRDAHNPDALDFFKRAFTLPKVTEFYYPPPSWRPLVHAWFFSAYRVFGLSHEPYHLANVVLHAGVASFAGLTLWRLSGRPLIGWLTALMFAVSPSYDLVVVSISHDTELLASFFFMLSLLLFTLSLGSKGRTALLYAGSVLAFGLSLLARESAVYLPLLLAGAGLLVLRPSDRGQAVQLARRLAPFFVVAGLFGVLAYAFEFATASSNDFYAFGFHAWGRFWEYMRWATFPLPPSYGNWVASVQRLTAVLPFVAGALAVVFRRWLVVWLVAWAVLALLPFVFITNPMELRYTYGATIPVAALLALAVDNIRLALKRWLPETAGATLALGAVLALAVFLGARARAQQDWISLQSDNYESLVGAVKTLCGPLPPDSHLYVVNSPAFDPYNINTPMAFNLYDDRIYVKPSPQPPEQVEQPACVVNYGNQGWQRLE